MTNQNTALTVAPGPTALQMSQDFAALVALKSAIMRRGTDYGTIPGCGDKAALFKPGAEKILKRFMVHVTDVQVEDIATPDCIRYRVRCIGTTPDGVVRGVGIGECSTDEDKYRWRKAGKKEFDDTIDERRRVKHYANYSQEQVRTNPADLANTVLKMAKKRAMVDLALTATAASDFFTQDIEDMSPEMRGQVAAERRARPADPFAPPAEVVEVEAEVVEPRPNPKRQIWQVAKELGLTGDDVKTVLGAQDMPDDAAKWTVNDVERVCTALHARATAEPVDEQQEQQEPTPKPSHHYDEARQLAAGLGASDDQWAHAVKTAGHHDTDPADWTSDTTDAVIGRIEQDMGA